MFMKLLFLTLVRFTLSKIDFICYRIQNGLKLFKIKANKDLLNYSEKL